MKALILALVLLTPLVAHPPSNIELEYDPETGILSVEVAHGVSDASKHYVNEVEVELNGVKLIEQSFRTQVDGEKQHAVYKVIDARVGDKFTVEAYCNISGKKKAQLEVTGPESNE